MAMKYQAVMLTRADAWDYGKMDVEAFGEVGTALNWLAHENAKATKARRVVLRAEIVKIGKWKPEHE